MDVKLSVVMIGPHGSGKTTLGKSLAKLLRWEYHEEIGKALRRQALLEHPDQTAEKSQPDFDLKVFELERQRDRKSFKSRIVETWHPGNLAYAESRSPEIANQYAELLKKHVQQLGDIVLVQPLEIDESTSRERLSEPGPDPCQMVEFFRKIFVSTLGIAKSWGLRIFPSVRTDQLNQNDSLRAIRHNLEEHGVIGNFS
jgi:energy-coupling factor transporter ATP-binding protein EcfA2